MLLANYPVNDHCRETILFFQLHESSHNHNLIIYYIELQKYSRLIMGLRPVFELTFGEFEKLTAEQLESIGFFLNLGITVSLQISSLGLDLYFGIFITKSTKKYFVY